MHKILVEGVILGDKKTQRFATSPAAPPCLLPGAGNTSRVAGEYCGFQVADVDTQFQSSGSHYTEEIAVE